MFLKSILLRKGLRSDKIWGNSFFFREPFRRIPFYMDVYALSNSQYWPREELKKMQLERFQELVKRASSMPFWRDRLSKAGIDHDNFKEEDISRIPILSKADFSKSDITEYTDPKLLLKSRQFNTSGSTGHSFSFYHDLPFELRISAVSERMFRAVGNGKRFPIILMKRLPNFGFDYANHHFFYLQGYNSVSSRFEELQKLSRTFKDKIILYALGSSLAEIGRLCNERNISLPLKLVLSTGEELTPLQKKDIETSLKVPVRISYGMSEMRRNGFECEHNRIHLNEESMFFEIAGQDGKLPSADESGRLLVTGFEQGVMPFIRYATGDTGIIHDDPCPCGRTLRTLEFRGRSVNFLNVGFGRTVSLIDLTTFFNLYSKQIRQFQVVRTGECAFTIRIVQNLPFFSEETEKVIVDGLRLRIHPQAEIECQLVDSIPEGPNGKARHFIDMFEKKS